MNLLIWIAALLGILVLVRLMNIVQLTSELSGENEEEEQHRDNKVNAILNLAFMIIGLVLIVYMTLRYSKFMLPRAATEHGVELDTLLWINFGVIGVVFFITQIALFWFAYKYRYDKNRWAYFYHENHKLEFIWTAIPTVVLSVLIITGLNSWNKITQKEHPEGLKIQVYGYQFNWIARYAGKDNTLGASNFRLITDTNPLGVDYRDKAAADDIMTTGNEMRLPVGIPIDMEFNAREVIHSAYFPHLRVQMNCVPGMTTRFHFKPTITTAEMRKITGDPNFDYVLLCNKICGVAHYTMKMKVVIETPEEFQQWVRTQKRVVETTTQTASEQNRMLNKTMASLY
jgi:cytochrome c oxidase subunit 2